MNYRNSDYLEKRPKCVDAKYPTFNPLVDEWSWSEKENQLVVSGQYDSQALVQSFENCALSKIFDKFIDDNEVRRVLGIEQVAEFTDDEPLDAESFKRDLVDLGEVMDMAECFRERYGLSPDMSYGQVFEFVQKNAKKSLEEVEKRVKSNNQISRAESTRDVDNSVNPSVLDSDDKKTHVKNLGGEQK